MTARVSGASGMTARGAGPPAAYRQFMVLADQRGHWPLATSPSFKLAAGTMTHPELGCV